MKSRLFTLVATIVLLVSSIAFQSCKSDKFTVMVIPVEISESAPPVYGSMMDEVYKGNYQRGELTNTEWRNFYRSVPIERRRNKYNWDEIVLKNWLISNGFDEANASKEAAWLATVNHGLLIFRDDDTIYRVLK